MQKIPQALADISAGWLAEVLDKPVSHYRVIDDHEGTTGRAVLALEYAGPGQKPDHLFVKLPPEDEMQRAFVTANGMGRREAMFYHHLSAEAPVRVPRCYYAGWDETGERYIMLLEHLDDSGCTFRNAATRYSLDYVRAVLAAFARLHATYWDSTLFKEDLDWLEPPVQHPVARDLVALALEQHADTMPVVFSSLGRLYQDHADAIHQLWNRGPHTLIHGDVHDGNLFYDGDRPGFLDWALVARGNPMRDVGYFLAGTLEVDDQRVHRLELLEYYHAELAAQGAPAPSTEELYRDYQWHAAYVWVGAAVTLAMGDAWQPVSYVRKTLERLHFALEELDTVTALEAAIGGGA